MSSSDASPLDAGTTTSERGSLRQAEGFRPSPFTAGGHRQTLLGYWHRKPLRWTLPAEDIVIDAGDDIRLLLRASFQPGPRRERPILVLVHGMGGSDQSSYMLATGLHAWELGWHVVRTNLRGAGDGEALCPRLYNAGLDTDLLAILDALAEISPRLGVVGFSLGASLALLTLGRNRDRLTGSVRAAAAVSPPLDLGACAEALGHAGNRLYQFYFLRSLREGYKRRQARLPGLYARGREERVRSIREYDEAITAPYGGYASAADYYARCSSGPHLVNIDRPTLLLAGADDPMIPASSIVRWPVPASGLVRRELVHTGGHVGFVARTSAPARFWAAQRVMTHLEAHTRW